MAAGQGTPLPDELVRTQQWLHEVFQEAGRGLPWPQQLGLGVVERLIALGMLGSLITSAWLVREAQAHSGAPAGMDVRPMLAALEDAAWGNLAPQVRTGLQALFTSGGAQAFERIMVALVSPVTERRF